MGNWDREREFTPWLLAIAGNRCRTWLAAHTTRPPTIKLGDHQAVDESTEASGILAEEIQLAAACLRREYRQALLLFHQDEMSYQEIAAALGCPVGTAKTWVHRARREMAELLAQRGAVELNTHAGAENLNVVCIADSIAASRRKRICGSCATPAAVRVAGSRSTRSC